MTLKSIFGSIYLAPDKDARLERYRSGHNEAVLKTVCPQGRVGSNPTLSAGDTFSVGHVSVRNWIKLFYFGLVWRSTQEAEGTPLERVQVVNSGARVQIPPSPFGNLRIASKLSKDSLQKTLLAECCRTTSHCTIHFVKASFPKWLHNDLPCLYLDK